MGLLSITKITDKVWAGPSPSEVGVLRTRLDRSSLYAANHFLTFMPGLVSAILPSSTIFTLFALLTSPRTGKMPEKKTSPRTAVAVNFFKLGLTDWRSSSWLSANQRLLTSASIFPTQLSWQNTWALFTFWMNEEACSSFQSLLPSQKRLLDVWSFLHIGSGASQARVRSRAEGRAAPIFGGFFAVYTLRAAHFIVHHRFCAPTIHRSCLGPSFGREKLRVAKC